MQGKRGSQWRVIQRCMRILLRLMRGPANTTELIDIIYQHAKENGEDPSIIDAEKRFERDKASLRTWFGCELSNFNKEYTLLNIEYPIIDLSDEAVYALAFLQQTFSNDAAPMRQKVFSLVDRVMMVVPQDTRKAVMKQRGLLEMELQTRDDDTISDDVWLAVRTSCAERRQLEFDYHTPQQQDGRPRRHLVEPIRYFFDAVWSHYYLEFFWIESRSHKGRVSQQKIGRFRLGRMSNPHILPKHFPPGRRIPTQELIYELTPSVARMGVTQHFPNSEITYREDGSAQVRVSSRDLFMDLRTLLHYGSNCRVTGGKEALDQMKRLVEGMYQQYV